MTVNTLYIIILIFQTIFTFAIAVYLVSLVYSSLMGSPYVATKSKDIEEILKHANLKKGQVFLELGCGDGRVVRQAVKRNNVVGIGIDVNGLILLVGRILSKLEHINNVTFLKKNVFTYPMNKADVVYIFLMPKLIEKLVPKMEKELKKNTLIISRGFTIPGWEKKLVRTVKQKPFSAFYYRK